MDLSKVTTIDAMEKPSEMTLLDPHSKAALLGDDKKPITFNVLSIASKISRNTVIENQKTELTDDEKNHIWFSKVCTGWSKNFKYNGKPFPFSEENAHLLAKEQKFIQEQALQHALNGEQYRPKF